VISLVSADFTVSAAVATIGKKAFDMCEVMAEITIGNPVCTIADSEDAIYSEAVIYGYAGSIAEKFAKKYNRKFVVIEGEIPTDENGPTLLGDANNDGTVTASDVAAIYQFLGNPDKYELSEQGFLNADIDDTEGITVGDAIAIMEMISF